MDLFNDINILDIEDGLEQELQLFDDNIKVIFKDLIKSKSLLLNALKMEDW